MRELEKSLLDLHQIFLDMAVLVEAQGEMLDNIEAQARLTYHLALPLSLSVSPCCLTRLQVPIKQETPAYTGLHVSSIPQRCNCMADPWRPRRRMVKCSSCTLLPIVC